MNFLVTRDMTKVKPMQVAYTAWCDDDGKMIEEGTIFRLGENDFILNAALHQLHWLHESAYGFDVASRRSPTGSAAWPSRARPRATS